MEETKHAGGRPSTYTPELVEKAKQYLSDWENAPRSDRRAIPLIADLARYLGISRSTLYLWANEHKEFSDITEEIMATQEGELVDGTLTERFNAASGRLMLSKHGYRESQDITSGDKPLSPLLVKFIDGKDSGDTTGV